MIDSSQDDCPSRSSNRFRSQQTVHSGRRGAAVRPLSNRHKNTHSPPTSKRDIAAYEYSTYNNRRYASASLGNYYMPNDAPEIHRLNEQHFLLTTLKDGALHHAPVPSSKPGLHILDVGCGSGIWCVEMAARYPEAMITGMDVSPIQPKNKPANVEWIVHDMEKEWPFADGYFDFIHLSLVHGCVADWNEMTRVIVRHLAPGGHMEHQEFSLCRQYTLEPQTNAPIRPGEDVDIQSLPPFLRWGRLMEQAGEKRGRTIQLGPKLVSFQRESGGLHDVTEKIFPFPCGTWPEGEKEKMLGARNMLQVLSGMEGFTMVLFTKVLGWGVDEAKAFVEEAKAGFRDDGLRKVMDVYVVWGRKDGDVVVEVKDGMVEQEPEEAWRSLTGSRSVQFASGVLFGGAVVGLLTGWIMRSRVR